MQWQSSTSSLQTRARRPLDFDRLSSVKGPTSEPLLILGVEADTSLASALAEVLADFGVTCEAVDRKLDDASLAQRIATSELVIVVVARPESVGAEVIGLVDRLVAARGRERVVVAVPQETCNTALLDLDRKRGIVVLDLGRRFDLGSEALRRLRKRVAMLLIAVTPLDLPASLYRTAIHQRSIELLAENPSLAASQPIRDWELARPGDRGSRPNPLWSSWIRATARVELARLGTHLDELRVDMLLGDDHEDAT
jgi:hypothetical protein